MLSKYFSNKQTYLIVLIKMTTVHSHGVLSDSTNKKMNK